MRHLALALTALALMAGAYVMGHHVATPAPTEVVGTYDTGTGTLTVYGDTSAHYAPTPTDAHMGACWVSGMYAACAPLFSPDGLPVGDVWEDGSAEYPGSAWYFDPEEGRFMPDTSPALHTA